MNKISLKQRIQNKENLYGLFCSIGSPIAVEQMALAGYDFIIIDLEHTLFSNAQIESMILAARGFCLDVLVRVPLQASHMIYPLMDAGVAGIVFPRIETAAEARQAVELCHYTPLGSRGLNSTRLNGYGTDDLKKSVEHAHQSTIVMLMIESMNGVEQLESILSIDGIDIILEGAADLSQSMGIPWETQHQKVKKILDDIHAKTVRAGKTFCAIPRKTEDIHHWQNAAVHLFVLGDDRSIVRRAHQQHLNAYKGT
ncbi:HpcH/HpaI aldolase family protein [Acinetobacter sp. WZC-1]|uniref:HpcH/HpaI aldolase family protein n=1 Tax=Acinetobacter sp. WZC-1 TaxID=3459034 RepID=UPI00403DB52B